jgi:hypothetical protein
MPKTREPAWWMLYALVPMMGGLLVLEFRTPLTPGWHKAVQVGIILFVYSLVWVWLWANDRAMLHDSANRTSLFWGERDDGGAAPRSARGLPGTPLTPRQRPKGALRSRSALRYINRRTHGREIRKCSHSSGRRSSHS